MIDVNSNKSIYIQISELIENDILLENLRQDEQAPSTNEFARIYQINPATARKGLNILVDEGILYKKRGMGMFVSPGAREKILKKRQKDFFDERLPEMLREASRLEIDEKQLVEYMEKFKEGQ